MKNNYRAFDSVVRVQLPHEDLVLDGELLLWNKTRWVGGGRGRRVRAHVRAHACVCVYACAHVCVRVCGCVWSVRALLAACLRPCPCVHCALHHLVPATFPEGWTRQFEPPGGTS